MRCDEAEEFVSALYDGETVPREAAEHLGTCGRCEASLKSYVAMGVELRRMASMTMPEEAKPPVWDQPRWSITGWWKGWGTMRVPRMAFALLLVGVMVLASRLAVVEVRAHSEGTVLLLKITPEGGQAWTCALSTTDKRWDVCGSMGGLNGEMLSYRIKLLRADGGRVQLGVQSVVQTPARTGSYQLSALDGLPEAQYWFEPGQTLQVAVNGTGPLSMTGEWTDHVPIFLNENKDLDPAPKELRVTSPLLLRGGQVVGDLDGGSAVVNKANEGVQIYIPGEGRFQLSLAPVAGAVAGHVRLNRLLFACDGEAYSLVTGTPMTRADTVWVLREARFVPSGDVRSAYLGSTEVSPMTAPETGKP